jgi:hypothetical protein
MSSQCWGGSILYKVHYASFTRSCCVAFCVAYSLFLFCRLCVTIFELSAESERLGVIRGRIVLLDFCEFVDAVRGIF